MRTAPKTMNAMVLTGHGGLDRLEWHEDWPTPKPDTGEVLIRVGACGLNNTDVNTRSGWYSKGVSGATTGEDLADAVHAEDPSWGGAPITFPRIQGADAVGEVVALGAGADPALMGRRVMIDGWLRDPNDPTNRDKTGYFGSERDGGFAQFTTAPAQNVMPVTCDLSDAELATFSCSYTTALGMLNRAGLTASDTVLVTGASGGVGSALVQLAKDRGARVVALSSESKHAEVRAAGADAVLPRSPANLKAALRDSIGTDRIDVVADIVGGPGFPALLDTLVRGGRYTCSGAIAGPMVDLDLRTFYLRDLTLTGSTVLGPETLRELVALIEAGRIRPLLAATFPLRNLHAAQTAFIEKKHTGNIAVIP